MNLRRYLLGFLVVILTVGLQSVQAAAVTTNRFQEGVSPTGGYTQDAVHIRESESDTNQDALDQIIIGTTETSPHILRIDTDAEQTPANDSLKAAPDE